jgi:hypothetical protein
VRASGEAFTAAALADVDVWQVMIRGMLHGFLNLPAVIEPVRRCLDLIAETVTQGGLCRKERNCLRSFPGTASSSR